MSKNMELNEKYKCNLLSYHYGNGLSISKGDDEMLAHISPNREVKIYDKEKLQDYEIDYINYIALTDDRDISVSQDTKVFNNRPGDNSLARSLEMDYIVKLNQSGYVGTLPNGNLVDRRIFPNAVPVQKNSIFGIPESKEL